MKLPPARLVKMMPTRGLASERARPIEHPTGVAKEKRNMNQNSFLNSNPLFCMAILIDMASANLCTKMDTIRLMKGLISLIRPSARPSKIACTLRAIIRTKGKKLNFSFLGFAMLALAP